jgi:hypothetical protein
MTCTHNSCHEEHSRVATAASLPGVEAGRTRPRRLLLCLDGVPHEIIMEAKNRGLFDNFGAPTRLLSPFPTMTNVALSQMLGATLPLGYESLYFNREHKELRGGWKKYVGWRTPDKVPSSYMDELDYQEPLMFEFLVYVAPDAVWQADMRKFRDKFFATPKGRDFFAFLKGTDGLMHIRGPEKLRVALCSLDKILREIQTACGRETEIVLFSDHGMNLEKNQRVHLQTHLKKRGFQAADKLNGDPRKVCAPAFGLCSYAALYCAESVREEVAAGLTDLTGVDFAVHTDGPDAVKLHGPRGVARIRKKAAGGRQQVDFYAYEQIVGDPLELEAITKNLASAGDGWASDEAWREATQNHVYPDAPANIFASLHAPRVGHTADVLISLQDGYFYGSSVFSRLASLAATHGNALRSSTNAFMMSTHRQLPEYVRAADAQPLLRG